MIQAPRSSGLQAYINSGLQVRGFTAVGGPIWHANPNVDDIYELAYADFSVVRQENSPDIAPYGIGGNESKIWLMEEQSMEIYELSTVDLTSVRFADGPGTRIIVGPTGAGGTSNEIYATNEYDDDLFELSTVDFSTVRSAASPSLNPRDIGGDDVTVWLAVVSGSSGWYKLSASDFSTIVYSSGTSRWGAGGKSDVMWASQWSLTNPIVSERNVTDLSGIRSAAAPAVGNIGIGGS